MEKRKIIDFNENWLFSPCDYKEGEKTDFDDSFFKRVCVPHANKILEGHIGNDFQRHIESYRFVSSYRKHFFVEDAGKRKFFVEFEAVATACEVFVNGHLAGKHKGAYTGFTVDISDLVTDGENVMYVRVDSTKHDDIPPEGGSVDYCLFGGIVRNVKLIVTNENYIDDVFVTTPVITERYAQVKCETMLFDRGRAVAEFFDADGTLVGVAEEDAKGRVELCCRIDNPILWDVDNPYLYTAKVSLYEDEKIDEVKVRFGIRYFEFKKEEDDGCFYLNGRMLKIRGVNRHEQWPWIGRAVCDKLQRRDADMVKDTGFNAVRCSHYPQSVSFLDRCDEIGLLVFEEAPGWQHTGDDSWQNLHIKNVCDMILRDRNHPSVITWGVRINESQDNRALWSEAKKWARRLDPTRISHGVRMMELYEMTENVEDIFCNNYVYPEKPRFLPFVITEHSMDWWEGDGFNDASDIKAAKFTKSFGDAMDYYYKNPLCAGGFAWSMFDYNNEVNYTRTGHVFPSGLYDLFRLEKPVSYLYRAQKSVSEEIVLYIASYWANDCDGKIEVYSNCDEVELLVNGVSKGTKRANLYTYIPHGAFLFENIEFVPGELEAVGYIDKKEAKRVKRLTPHEGRRLVVTADYDTLLADGADMTNVNICLVDENGTRLPYADNTVTISVFGSADFIGEKIVKLEGGRMGCIVKSRHGETGNVIVEASCEGVEPGECTIAVKKR